MNRLFFLTVLLPSILIAQHTINGKFSPAKDYNVALLYKVTPTLSEYITNTEVAADGSFQFKLDASATKGMYRVVYAVPQEDYNFDIIYNGKEDIDLTFNSETGVTFQNSIENKLLASYTNSMSMITQSLGNYFRQQNEDTLALKTIFKTQAETQSSFESAGKNTIALSFIKANKPYIPKKFEDVNTYVDSLKAHYFDFVDFNNKTLQSSSFLEERMLNYVFGMSFKSVDEITSYKKNIDVFCEAMKNAPIKVKRILLVDLWQQMADLNHENVANYIAETYLMDIAVSLNDQELLHGLILFKNLSIGSVAPDFSLEIVKDKKTVTKKLSKLDVAERYVILFWSSTCSHCLDEVPQLQTYIQSKEKGRVKVVAVALEEDTVKWKNLISGYPEFIHVYGAGKWENEIGNDYGVTATPTYFVLDKDKHIVSKPESFEDLKLYFEKE
ncbi:TlpA family protein disulfide reductase [Flavivirga spongiicola]|uniref:TlpA family protein disulfide reductase n=1 Tax=Flavivirga spongiicola TaxID=421621 RepID=A0ABU7XSD5_9FLAO|nr:TlpA disulfide reductase family protein [Flavivirga sp. MEBiC05379]MDO5978665.1 TlpA disulfide reductase family protein [Flavivirga sp. MEBiC05379]